MLGGSDLKVIINELTVLLEDIDELVGVQNTLGKEVGLSQIGPQFLKTWTDGQGHLAILPILFYDFLRNVAHLTIVQLLIRSLCGGLGH